jgi:VIT1/CCC1 family predicted Fe2+/Mn2+ transporter
MGGLGAQELRRLQRNWQAERDSAALYAALASFAREPTRRGLYEDLARAEERHAAFWEQRLRSAGRSIPTFRASARTRVLIQLARHLGAGFVVPSVITREMRDRDDYASQDDARAGGLELEEQGHAALLRSDSDAGIGTNLRAAVLGANDGLVSNLCLMMGVAGGGASAAAITLSGVAGLVGGACSMALGEWLSVTNQRELALSQLDRAAGSATPDPRDPSVAAAGNAARAAFVSFLLFAIGAAVPLLSFGLLPRAAGIPASIAVSCLALFFLGVATSLFNARPALFSGLRQTLIGAAAAAVTYLVGRLFGALTGGAL